MQIYKQQVDKVIDSLNELEQMKVAQEKKFQTLNTEITNELQKRLTEIENFKVNGNCF